MPPVPVILALYRSGGEYKGTSLKPVSLQQLSNPLEHNAEPQRSFSLV